MIIVAGTPLKSLFDLVADRPAAPASDEARDYAARVETAREELEAKLTPALKTRARAGDL